MRKLKWTMVMGSLLVMTTQFSFGQEVVVYPKKGQSEKQQSKDKYDCYEWAKKQTGIDPHSMASASSSTTQQPSGGAARGAGRGAAVGAIGGAIGGDAGKGAAIGAGVGAAGGAARRRQAEKQSAQAQQQAQAKQSQSVASFNKAESACLAGRGYSVG